MSMLQCFRMWRLCLMLQSRLFCSHQSQRKKERRTGHAFSFNWCSWIWFASCNIRNLLLSFPFFSFFTLFDCKNRPFEHMYSKLYPLSVFLYFLLLVDLNDVATYLLDIYKERMYSIKHKFCDTKSIIALIIIFLLFSIFVFLSTVLFSKLWLNFLSWFLSLVIIQILHEVQ